MKKAVIFTSNRSEWGLLKLLADRMKEVYDLKIIACASHLDKRYNTIEDIDGFDYEVIENTISSNTNIGCCKSSGVLMITLPDIIKKISPEFVVLLGDRYETFCAAYTCYMMGIKIVHLHGGERSGNVDDAFRDCITRMSYVHCVATDGAYRTLVGPSMLSPPFWVYLNGALGCEGLESVDYIENMKKEKKILLIYHPNTIDTIDTIDTNEDIDILFEELIFFLRKEYKEKWDNFNHDFNYTVTAILPNNDFGSIDIFKKIRSCLLNLPCGTHCISHLKRSDFIEELKTSVVIVGNSSAGIIEAPILGIPTINIGSRQVNRERASSIIDTNQVKTTIASALLRVFEESRRINFDYIPYVGYDKNNIPASQSILNSIIKVFGK